VIIKQQGKHKQCKSGSPSGAFSVQIHPIVFINCFKWTIWVG